MRDGEEKAEGDEALGNEAGDYTSPAPFALGGVVPQATGPPPRLTPTGLWAPPEHRSYALRSRGHVHGDPPHPPSHVPVRPGADRGRS